MQVIDILAEDEFQIECKKIEEIIEIPDSDDPDTDDEYELIDDDNIFDEKSNQFNIYKKIFFSFEDGEDKLIPNKIKYKMILDTLHYTITNYEILYKNKELVFTINNSNIDNLKFSPTGTMIRTCNIKKFNDYVKLEFALKANEFIKINIPKCLIKVLNYIVKDLGVFKRREYFISDNFNNNYDKALQTNEVANTDPNQNNQPVLVNSFSSNNKKPCIRIGPYFQANLPILLNKDELFNNIENKNKETDLTKQKTKFDLKLKRSPTKLDYYKSKDILEEIIPFFDNERQLFKNELFMAKEILKGIYDLKYKRNNTKIIEIEDDLPMVKYLYNLAVQHFESKMHTLDSLDNMVLGRKRKYQM